MVMTPRGHIVAAPIQSSAHFYGHPAGKVVYVDPHSCHMPYVAGADTRLLPPTYHSMHSIAVPQNLVGQTQHFGQSVQTEAALESATPVTSLPPHFLTSLTSQSFSTQLPTYQHMASCGPLPSTVIVAPPQYIKP